MEVKVQIERETMSKRGFRSQVSQVITILIKISATGLFKINREKEREREKVQSHISIYLTFPHIKLMMEIALLSI